MGSPNLDLWQVAEEAHCKQWKCRLGGCGVGAAARLPVKALEKRTCRRLLLSSPLIAVNTAWLLCLKGALSNLLKLLHLERSQKVPLHF
jgi:hypothetical protein